MSKVVFKIKAVNNPSEKSIEELNKQVATLIINYKPKNNNKMK